MRRNVYKVIDRKSLDNLDLDTETLLDTNRKSQQHQLFDIVPVKSRISIADHYKTQYASTARNYRSSRDNLKLYSHDKNYNPIDALMIDHGSTKEQQHR
jgi:hypothetical protein